MPREIRKRGKKKAKVQTPSVPEPAVKEPDTPSWMQSTKPNPLTNDLEAPFGYVEADVKAYFRTVDLCIRDWQSGTGDFDLPEDVDPNQERRSFIIAALSEMSGKELQLSTDPDCSGILERMAYSMDDFVRRVFMDCLAGSYERLTTHRFASHVCQTHLTLARDTISREARGIVAIRPAEADPSDSTELRTMTQLVLDATEELLPRLARLVMDPFASHVVRTLLTLLVPSLSSSDTSSTGPHGAPLRSKKSAAYKARQGPMKSVFKSTGDNDGSRDSTTSILTPPGFGVVARRFVHTIRTEMDDNEIRALASDKVASPVLQMMLRLEAESGEAEMAGSLMDRVLMGMISRLIDGQATLDREDYLETLMRDPTSSHLLEVLALCAPPRVFQSIWTTYFVGRLPKLVTHPVANFVVAKAVERLEAEEDLRTVWLEMGGVAGELGRTGVLRAMIDRAATKGLMEEEMVETVSKVFGFSSAEDRILFVPCVLRLKTLEAFRLSLAAEGESVNVSRGLNEEVPALPRHQAPNRKKSEAVPFSTQGAIILQSMLRLHEPYNEVVCASIGAMSIENLLTIACDPTGSRVLDVVLESPTVSPRIRRKLIVNFVGHFHSLVDDKLGSRVADRCWAVADPYLRERIARSLIPHERFLAGSFYGKFFARNLHLTLLQRKPEEWKALQTKAKTTTEVDSSRSVLPPSSSLQDSSAKAEGDSIKIQKKTKRKHPEEDPIDSVFSGAGKLQRNPTRPIVAPVPVPESGTTMDKGLSEVLGAIKDVPKGTALRERKRSKRA
ncbi:hypothetical protein BS47DRAFT_1289620 [Hydnum rufescens UP504]|uniref:Nucleolar protein 9 n=1 Tax=Hydnum rufescens UP504 TaxID=1448309 RepID=A0A9P6B8Z8_9AGAM|nr:hypothetical protein BS47DRAFT_1289620 [Hydnum rufescens UP504]